MLGCWRGGGVGHAVNAHYPPESSVPTGHPLSPTLLLASLGQHELTVPEDISDMGILVHILIPVSPTPEVMLQDTFATSGSQRKPFEQA